jgi:hypothetical protein
MKGCMSRQEEKSGPGYEMFNASPSSAVMIAMRSIFVTLFL